MDIPKLPKNLRYKFTETEWTKMHEDRVRRDQKTRRVVDYYNQVRDTTNNFRSALSIEGNDDLIEFAQSSQVKSTAGYMSRSKNYSPVYMFLQYLIGVVENKEQQLQATTNRLRTEVERNNKYFKVIDERLTADGY
jgi:hypothetical protein